MQAVTVDDGVALREMMNTPSSTVSLRRMVIPARPRVHAWSTMLALAHGYGAEFLALASPAKLHKFFQVVFGTRGGCECYRYWRTIPLLPARAQLLKFRAVKRRSSWGAG